jgi:hypothetical protein
MGADAVRYASVIALTATIRHHRLGIIPCTADLPPRVSNVKLI